MANPKGILLPIGLLVALACACEQQKAAPPDTPPPAKQVPADPPPAQPPADPNAAPADPAASAGDPVKGKKLYATGCMNCHGPDGTGAMMRQMLPKIGDLTSAEMHGRLKDDEIALLIVNGRDKMPPFGAVFKPHQIKDIIAYVRTMKKGG